MDDVEAAGTQAKVERRRVDDDLVALAHLTEQHLVGPGTPLLSVDLHNQGVGRDDDPTTEVQPAAHARARMPSQTSSIRSRSVAATCSR